MNDQKPQMNNVAEIECVDCHKQLKVRIPKPRIANAIDVTFIAFAHERLDKCPECGAVYIFNIDHIEPDGKLSLMWVKVSSESSIVPGTQNNLTQATQQDDVAKKIKIH
jgi:hypothetical protein